VEGFGVLLKAKASLGESACDWKVSRAYSNVFHERREAKIGQRGSDHAKSWFAFIATG
jgi:hypothetical protein